MNTNPPHRAHNVEHDVEIMSRLAIDTFAADESRQQTRTIQAKNDIYFSFITWFTARYLVLPRQGREAH